MYICSLTHTHSARATEVRLQVYTAHKHKGIHSTAGVDSYYSPSEYMTETEKDDHLMEYSVLWALSLSLSFKRTDSEVLIIQRWPLDNSVLKLRWDDIKRPVPFWTQWILQSTERHFDKDREKEPKRKHSDSLRKLAIELEFQKLACPLKRLNPEKFMISCQVTIPLSGHKHTLYCMCLIKKKTLKWYFDLILMCDEYCRQLASTLRGSGISICRENFDYG